MPDETPLRLSETEIKLYAQQAKKDTKGAKKVKDWVLYIHKDGCVSLQTVLVMKDGTYFYHNTAL